MMADLDRDLPLRGNQRSKPEDDKPRTFVDLLHAVLTRPNMLVNALVLMDMPLFFIAVLLGKAMPIAILGAATLTLVIWAVLRDRKAELANRRANDFEADDSESDPSKKGLDHKSLRRLWRPNSRQ
jgi:hypothetical protein